MTTWWPATTSSTCRQHGHHGIYGHGHHDEVGPAHGRGQVGLDFIDQAQLQGAAGVGRLFSTPMRCRGQAVLPQA